MAGELTDPSANADATVSLFVSTVYRVLNRRSPGGRSWTRRQPAAAASVSRDADARRSLPVVPPPRSPNGARPRPGSAAHPPVRPICVLDVGHLGAPGDRRVSLRK